MWKRREPGNCIKDYFSKWLHKFNNEPTKIQRRQIDHIYINKPTLVRGIKRCSPYYSDHDAAADTENQGKYLTDNIHIFNFFLFFRSGQMINPMMNGECAAEATK